MSRIFFEKIQEIKNLKKIKRSRNSRKKRRNSKKSRKCQNKEEEEEFQKSGNISIRILKKEKKIQLERELDFFFIQEMLLKIPNCNKIHEN